MKRFLALLLLLLCLPLCVLADAVYTYSGPTLTCMSSSCLPETPAVTATLTFTGALDPSTEYTNPSYPVTPGATDVTGLLTSWSLTDGYRTVTSADPYLLFSLYLQTDAAGNIAAWDVSGQFYVSAYELALIATSTVNSDASFDLQFLPDETPQASMWFGSPAEWSADPTATPEPATIALSGLSLFAVGFWRRRVRR